MTALRNPNCLVKGIDLTGLFFTTDKLISFLLIRRNKLGREYIDYSPLIIHLRFLISRIELLGVDPFLLRHLIGWLK